VGIGERLDNLLMYVQNIAKENISESEKKLK